MRLRITALLLTFAGAANCLRMAAKRRPHNTKSRIVRVTGGKASVLYSDGARQWTIDGSRLKHFELDDLRKRDFDKLDDGTLLFSPEAGLTGEPSFLFSFTPGAKLLYAVAADRARGDVSTGECSSFSQEVERILNLRKELAAKGVRAHIALVDVLSTNVDEFTSDGTSPPPRRPSRVTRSHDRALRAGFSSTWLSEEQLARLPEPVWAALEIVAMALELRVERALRR